MLQIIIYHRDYLETKPLLAPKRNPDCVSTDETIARSVRRSRVLISDYVLCNKFDMWCTFTFNKQKHDRQDVNHCKSVMQLWLERRKRKNHAFKYLIVPEYHKDGALHFHALISGYNGTLKATKLKTKTNKIVHVITGYRAGNAQAVFIDDDYDRIIGYLKKYITKDMPLLYGKRRFWCSTNLNKPIKTRNGIAKFKLWQIIKNHEPACMTQDYEIQYHPKGNLPLSSGISDIMV